MTGLPILLWHYAAAKRNARRWHHRTDLEAWQDRAVRKHLARVLPRSPFYRRLYANQPLREWSEFPVTNKAALTAHFDDWNTVGLKQDTALAIALKAERTRDFAPMVGDITIGLSSGTSGNRGLFLVRPAERFAWAGNLLAKILPGSLFERQRAAFCFRASSNLYRAVASRRFAFGFFDLLRPVPQLLRQLESFQPTLLIAPPFLLRLLADASHEGRLDIRPTRIFSVAEVLEPQERAYIAEHFQQRLHEIYQATEGFLAATCAHGTLHLNEDVIVVQKEWVDRAQRKFVPIITDFRRTTQPILRYRLDDILTERATPCPCGSVFTGLDGIEGRCDDVLHFPAIGGTSLLPVFPDFIRRAIISSDGAIEEYAVTQSSLSRLEIALQIPLGNRARAQDAVRRNVAMLFDQLGCRCPELHFVEYLPPPIAAKRRRVQVQMSRPAQDG